MLLASESIRTGEKVEAEERYQHTEHVYRSAAQQNAGNQQ